MKSKLTKVNFWINCCYMTFALKVTLLHNCLLKDLPPYNLTNYIDNNFAKNLEN